MAKPNPLQSDLIISFLTNLSPAFRLPDRVEIMNPFRDELGLAMAKQFYAKFYADSKKRVFIFGINPGRLGGGITGIPFTDPLKLETVCGIPNDLAKKAELSADFIYKMIDAYGGVNQFYSRYFFTAVCPLGFTKNGKNMNYYDDRKLAEEAETFITDCIEQQIQLLETYDTCLCLGEGANYKYLSQLNQRKKYFKSIIPLAHPRFIMQYRRKFLEQYIEKYLNEFEAIEKEYFC
jgi:Domain of unknown function (DUF4918)